MKNIFYFAVIFLTVVLLQADEIYWPASARIPAQLKEVWSTFDHAPRRTYILTMNGMRLDVSELLGFSAGPNDPRWNATFVLAEQPTVRCGIAMFERGAFLLSVSPDNLQKYIDGLAKRGATNIDSSFAGTLNDTMMIGGYQPLIVEYTFGKIHHREYFTESGSQIFVLGYEAPENIFGSRLDNARLMFSRIKF